MLCSGEAGNGHLNPARYACCTAACQLFARAVPCCCRKPTSAERIQHRCLVVEQPARALSPLASEGWWGIIGSPVVLGDHRSAPARAVGAARHRGQLRRARPAGQSWRWCAAGAWRRFDAQHKRAHLPPGRASCLLPAAGGWRLCWQQLYP